MATNDKSATYTIRKKKNEIIFKKNHSEICINETTQNRKTRAFSSAGSEHLPYKQRVGGSNPSTPTNDKGCFTMRQPLFFTSLAKLRATIQRQRLQEQPVPESTKYFSKKIIIGVR